MIVVVCTALSAVGFYLSLGFGEQWWLAWLAPMPVLWLAFGETKGWQSFLACGVAFALGSTNLLQAYTGLLPPQVLALAVLAPSLFFALSAFAGRSVARALGPLAGAIAFASLWAGIDFLISFDSSGGAAGTPAASQVEMPILIQTASLAGYTAITFLLGFVAATAALALRRNSLLLAAIAVTVFVANAAFGLLRVSTEPGSESMRVALIDGDETTGAIRKDDKEAALRAIDAYAREIGKLRDKKMALVVLPENIARLAPEWRAEVEARLAQAASNVQATIVAGFNTAIDGAQYNVALAFVPDASEPAVYRKRQLVPGLETNIYARGSGPLVLANGIAPEICKDMDFQMMVRADVLAMRPRVWAVPAWDFNADGWVHARIAMLRSVENGVAMARSARNGVLTLSDRYGRVGARASTTAGFTTLTGDLSTDGGATLYGRIGDSFAWLTLALAAVLIALSLLRRGRS